MLFSACSWCKFNRPRRRLSKRRWFLHSIHCGLLFHWWMLLLLQLLALTSDVVWFRGPFAFASLPLKPLLNPNPCRCSNSYSMLYPLIPILPLQQDWSSGASNKPKSRKILGPLGDNFVLRLKPVNDIVLRPWNAFLILIIVLWPLFLGVGNWPLHLQLLLRWIFTPKH